MDAYERVTMELKLTVVVIYARNTQGGYSSIRLTRVKIPSRDVEVGKWTSKNLRGGPVRIVENFQALTRDELHRLRSNG
jgi:hypothetical protein